MLVSLDPRLKRYVDKKVTEGEFSDATAVITYAIERLRAEDAWFTRNATALRRELAVGVRQLDRGMGEEWDVEQIKSEGRRLLRQRRNAGSRRKAEKAE